MPDRKGGTMGSQPCKPNRLGKRGLAARSEDSGGPVHPAATHSQATETERRKGRSIRSGAKTQSSSACRSLHELKVQLLPVASLKPWVRNPRTHSARQIEQIADSIREFGFVNPVLIDADRGVIAGHGRVKAAGLLGIESVPTIRLDGMTEAQRRAYVLADNKLAENAGWDYELLGLELQYLSEIDLDFDLDITGFEAAQIDVLIQRVDPAGRCNDADDVIPEPDESPVSRIGDLWSLERHRLLCSDATKVESFESLLGGEKAQMIFIDPPYNVPINGHVCGSGSIKHREFAMASGEMSEAEFTIFLKTVFGLLAYHSVAGSIHYVCMDWRHIRELLSASHEVYDELKNLCIWNKDNGGQGSFYRSKHELVFVFKHGSRPHINNIELGRHGRYRTNVWDYAGVNSLREDRLQDLAMHPTVKPVALVADAVLDCSRPDGIVLDCFSGSGTTLIAAEKTRRRGFAIELDPAYVDVAIRRFEKLTGKQAYHVESGVSFAEMQRRRRRRSQ
jgi:DNA modification methylase